MWHLASDEVQAILSCLFSLKGVAYDRQATAEHFDKYREELRYYLMYALEVFAAWRVANAQAVRFSRSGDMEAGGVIGKLGDTGKVLHSLYNLKIAINDAVASAECFDAYCANVQSRVRDLETAFEAWRIANAERICFSGLGIVEIDGADGAARGEDVRQ